MAGADRIINMIHYGERWHTNMSTKRDHLRRLDVGHYRGRAIVHWSMAILGRRQGWLNAAFYYRFRELLTHAGFRYGIACPIFCLMPDHFHILWIGLFDNSDQLLAVKHFRKSVKESLARVCYDLQDQAYDHVLSDKERQENAFKEVCEYIARNPERAGLVERDGYRDYPYTGCLVPGYPQLRPFEPSFWDEFDRVIAFIREHGLCRFRL